METDAVVRAVSRNCSILVVAGLFSGAINVLALTGSIYMLVIYDRVLPSRSVPMLVILTLAMFALYTTNGLFDFFRLRLLSRAGRRIDANLSENVFAATQLLALRTRTCGDGMQPLRDLDQIRAFLSGLGPTALFDLPWMPVYLAVIYYLHPLLGVFATAGALLLICLTVLTEARSAGPIKATCESGSKRWAFGAGVLRNAEAIRAMGLRPQLGRRWAALNAQHVDDQLRATCVVNGIGSVTRATRSVLQSGILGLGAYLVINGAGSAGTIIAASILLSRALAPVETAIAHWRGFNAARQGYRRLVTLMTAVAHEDGIGRPSVPQPHTRLTVDNLSITPPGAAHPVIHGVSFSLDAGAGLGIIGPSASGKSTLARALVGAWQIPASNGCVRLDGTALDQWDPDALGRHIGYLPQDIELFQGTVAENIARFDPKATNETIVCAARAAGAHEMIACLHSGYETQIGEGGAALSAGQRQRIGLARALFADPFLVVLDEPNANLDARGNDALTKSIAAVRRRAGIVIIIAHRSSALAAVDHVLAMANGRVHSFGLKEDVLARVLKPVPFPLPVTKPQEAHISANGGVAQHLGRTATL